MRLRLLPCLIALGLLVSAIPLQAQGPIPVYPGSKAEFELNLTQKDFLPLIRQWVGMIPGIAAGFAGAGGPPGQNQQLLAMGQDAARVLQASLANVSQISVVAYPQPKNASMEQLADFYVREMGLDNGWLRTFMGSRPEGSAMLYVKPDLTAIFAAGAGRGYVAAARIDGKVDLEAIGSLVAKYAPMITQFATTGTESVQQVPTPGWSVVLTEVGPQRIRVLGAIRDLTGMTPTEARGFVESLPQTLADGLQQDEADKLASQLMSMGANVEVQETQ